MKNRILFINFILYIFVQKVLTQASWERLPSISEYNCEDIVMNNLGHIYFTPNGRNVIFHSTDYGQHWRNIVTDTFRYNTIGSINHKSLFIDHNDSLIEFFYDFDFPFPRYYNGKEFIFDSLLFSQNSAFIGFNVKFDESGNYFYQEGSKLRKYNRRWFDSQVIFDKSNRIGNYFVYNDSINYVVLDGNGYFDIYKLNTSNKSSILCSRPQFITNYREVLISKDGTVFIPTTNGLFISRDEGKTSELVHFDPAVNSSSFIRDIRFTKKGDIVMLADTTFYYSADRGIVWHRLGSFNNNFPKFLNIVKLEILDSTSAILVIEPKCDQEKAFILSPTTNTWNKVDVGLTALLPLSYLFKTADSRLIWRSQTCEVKYSDDDARTFNNLQIDSNDLFLLRPSQTGTLFAITKESKKLYSSDDEGKHWNNISDQMLGIANIELLDIYPIVDQSLIIIGGRNKSGGKYSEYFSLLTRDNGKTWKILPKSSNDYMQGLLWDNKNRLISYIFKSKIVYYSEDFGHTWEVDQRFKDFSEVYIIYFNSNGSLIVQGVYKGTRNVYISADGVNFIPVNGNQFNDWYVYFQEVKYPTIISVDRVNGVYRSDDGGLNWEDFSSGLEILDTMFTLISSIYVAKDFSAYLAIQYDGFYKTSAPLILKQEDHNIKDNFRLFPNPFDRDVIIQCEACAQSNATFELFNSFGQLVWKQNLTKEFSQIHLNVELTKGLYKYRIISNNRHLYSGKALKW